jgi:hypothetical protein
LIRGRITLEEAIKGSNEPTKMITVLKTPWLTGLDPKALHSLLGQGSDNAIHLAATRPRSLNSQMGCDLFRERFSESTFDPKDRGRGSEWFLWRKARSD